VLIKSVFGYALQAGTIYLYMPNVFDHLPSTVNDRFYVIGTLSHLHCRR